MLRMLPILLGLFAGLLPARTVEAKEPVSAWKPVDRFGDRLPKGAIARLGKFVSATTATDRSTDQLPKEAICRLEDFELKRPSRLLLQQQGLSPFSPHGKWIIGGRTRNSLWNLRTGRKLRTIADASFGFFTPKGRPIAVTLSADRTKVRLIDMSSGIERQRFRAKDLDSLAITGLRVSPNGAVLLLYLRGKHLRIGQDHFAVSIATESGKVISKIRLDSKHFLFRTKFSLDHKAARIAALDRNDLAWVWETKSGKLVHRIRLPSEIKQDDETLRIRYPARGVRLSPDGSKLFIRAEAAVGNRVGSIRAYGLSQGKLLATIPNNSNGPPGNPGYTVSADGHHLVTRLAGRTTFPAPESPPAGLWHVPTGKLIKEIKNAESAQHARISLDGSFLLARINSRRALLVWSTKRKVDVFANVRAGIGAKAFFTMPGFSSDGRILSFQTFNARLEQLRFEIWDLSVGRRLKKLSLTSPAMGGVSKCGRYFVTFPYRNRRSSRAPSLPPYVWQLSKHLDVAKGSDLNLAALWDSLGSKDIMTARGALYKFIERNHDETVRFFQNKLKPTTVDKPGIVKLIRQLDNDDFTRRSRATQALVVISRPAWPIMDDYLKANKASPELRGRIQQIKAQSGFTLEDPILVRRVYAVQVLEAIGNANARRLLKRLAAGASTAPQTEAAQSALLRLKLR